MKKTGNVKKDILEYLKDDRIRLVAFWIIFGILFFVRVYQFGSVPGDINQDEAFAGYNAYTLAHTARDSFGYKLPMYLTTWGSGMNALETYLSIPFVGLFGTHAWTIRIVPCICAIFSLVAVYKIFRTYTNDLLALFAFFFAGIMPWHIMLSRWALESNLAPAFLIFGLYFFLKGGEKDEKYFLLSALFYGLSLYAYATIWVVVPFIVLLQVVYLILCRKITVSRYTLGSAGLLFVLALPALLFLLVNKGKIDEIRLPFLTIPKLLYFRGNEISIGNISENFKNLWHIIWTQNDGLPWNATEKYGILYPVSLPFTLVGLITVLIDTVKKWRKKEFSIEVFLLIQFLAGIVVGLLINVNINRVNLLFFPMICLTIYGLHTVFVRCFSCFKLFEKWKYFGMLIPVLVYSVLFIQFETYYFTEYKELIGGYFCEGLEDALQNAGEKAADDTMVYITPNANYARVLFYVKEDLEEYLDSVSYTNYPAAFLDVSSFGKYAFSFDYNSAPDGSSVYVIDGPYMGTYLVSMMESSGYESVSSGNYTVFYPKQ